MDAHEVRGLVLDEAILFEECEPGSVQLLCDATRFLCRLRYSNLFIGVLSLDVSRESLNKKETLLKEIGVLEAIQLVALSEGSFVKEGLENLALLWGIPSAACAYVTGQRRDLIEGWATVHLASGGIGELSGGGLTVRQLQEIPAVLARLNRRALGEKLIVVGHTMKWSRELEFLKRGALPLVSNKYGLSFIPVHLDQPLEQQLKDVDVILHKATDESVSIQSGEIRFSEGIHELQRFLQNHPNICVVDPLDRVLPLLDRAATQAILQSLEVPGKQIIRAPRRVEVTTLDEPGLTQALESENLVLPTIVKPRIACGASEAHTMAVVFRKEGFHRLPVPLPATVQEYIDHGGVQYKMYVVGSKLLYSRRGSTPNAAALASANNGAPSVVFDSLRSLPVAVNNAVNGETVTTHGGASEDLNMEAVQAAVNSLGKKLRLTIFGFDLVIQEGTNDYVIVDVNYFPSFKDVPDLEAIPAFWDALSTAHCQWNSA